MERGDEGEEAKVVLEGQTSAWQGMMESRGCAFMDLIFRFTSLGETAAALIAMSTIQQTFPLSTRFSHSQDKFLDLPALQYFVIANWVCGGYLLMSMTVSVGNVVKPEMVKMRCVMMPFDTLFLALQISGAAAATAIEYLANRGDGETNWFAICQELDSFCRQSILAIAASFASVVSLFVIVSLSALTLFPRLGKS